MNRSMSTWWPLHRGKGRFSREPGAALFQGLRIRLTLWYCLVLGAALVLFGLSLYLLAQYFLLGTIENRTATQANDRAKQWLADTRDHGCGQFPEPPPGQGFTMPMLMVCFDRNGFLLPYGNTTGSPPGFLTATNTLVQSALQSGSAADIVNGGAIVNGGSSVGDIYRYAQAAPNHEGVVMVGAYIQSPENELSLLLVLLLTVGSVALLGAGVGGLFLANRALVPARLAWANQQRFIADAAHELRTPLTLLRADAEVLLRSRQHLEEEDAALLEDIVAEANHMSNLATNLLTLARLDNSSSHREHEVVNLADVASAGARRIQALADQAEISIREESNDTALVIGDPTLLEQAILALLDNSIKYNRHGGHVMVRTATEQGQAILEVSDSGIGIADEHLPHLGERFYRVDKARSREAGGTGLGLSIAQGIAIAHGGTLTLTSIPDQGTTVTLKLPLAHGTSLDHIDEVPGSLPSLPERTL
jgi:signal transduction histidine kinase